MKYSLGLYEKALPSDLSWEEKFCTARECGFDRLEISIDESEERQARLDWPVKKQRELGLLAKENETPIRTMCLSGHRKWPMGSHEEAVRKRSMEIMRKAVDFSAEAGVSVIQLAGYDVYYETGDADTEKWFGENLFLASEYAAEKGVILAFETMETPFMDTVEKAMHYVSRVNSPYLGVYPDIGNLKNAAVKYHTDVVEDLLLGRGHTFAMHLKETKPGIYRDLNFGSGGHTEYVNCIEAGLNMGVCMFTGEFWYQKGQDYKAVIRQSNDFLRKQISDAIRRTEKP